MNKTTAKKTKNLLQSWLEVKAAEDAAKKMRIEIEAELSTRPEIEIKPEGSKTIALDEYKVETKGTVSFALNLDAWKNIEGEIPAESNPVVSKLSVNPTKARQVRENDPELWLTLCEAITLKPGKPGFKVSKVV
jgi:hypothetical protein